VSWRAGERLREHGPVGIEVRVEGDDLVVRTGGLDTLLTLTRELRIARSDITDAQLLPVADAKATLGWRIGGGYFPRGFATGWFLWKGRRGLWQWWCVFRDDEVLVIDTDQPKPARLVIQTPDRAAIAKQLGT